MNFFRDKELAERFAADNVSEREKLYYLLFYVLIFAIFTGSFFDMPENYKRNIWDHVCDTMDVVIPLGGCLWLYNINANGDNKNFIERYISLSFPISIKCTLYSILLLVPIYIILAIWLKETYKITLMPENESSYFLPFMILPVFIYYYLRLAYVMKIASRPVS
jgi:hypothetical protein